MPSKLLGTDRGQAHTLEGVMASILVVISLVLAYQAIVLTPTTAGTVDRDVKSHLGTRASDVLDSANEEGSLSRVLRFWNASGPDGSGSFVEAGGAEVRKGYGYQYDTPPGEFGELLSETFTDNGFVVNVYLESRDPENPSETETHVLVKRGEPTGNAASASATVTLYDYQRLTTLDGTSLQSDPDGQRLGELGRRKYFAGNLDGPVYNIVTVRVVVW